MINLIPISFPVGLSAKVLDFLTLKERPPKDLFLAPKESHFKNGQLFSPTSLLVGLSAKVLDLLAPKDSLDKGLLITLKESKLKDLFLPPKESVIKKGQPFSPTPLLVGLSAKVLDLLPLKESPHKDLSLPPKESVLKKGQVL